MEIIKRIYGEIKGTNKYVDVSTLERFLRDARQCEEFNTLDENIIGLKHSDFLQLLMSKNNKTNTNPQLTNDTKTNYGDERD